MHVLSVKQLKREELKMQIESTRVHNGNNNVGHRMKMRGRVEQNNFGVVNASKRLYKFDENNVDAYIEMFEKMAPSN